MAKGSKSPASSASVLTLVAIICRIEVSLACNEVRPRVRLPSNLVSSGEGIVYEGKYEQSATGRYYASFSGIPYAEPPVGELRFKPPIPVVDEPNSEEDDNDVREASSEGSPCLQFDAFDAWQTNRVIGDEDCLYLNVFAPANVLPQESTWQPKNTSKADQRLLPVMVYIHGGGFVYGSSTATLYNPMYIMDRDVVLVTFNYRLNVLGFLSTEDADFPGNMGLLDQVAAFKWVKENIVYFGGNPELMTIFGQSAGGASVNMHLVSPHSLRLFQGAISQSGVANAPWALQPHALKNAQKLATLVECPSKEKHEMMECLKKVPAKALVEAFNEKMVKEPFLPMIFVPRIDKEAKRPFLPEHPLLLMKEGRINKVPWIAGIVSDDGLGLVYGALLDDAKLSALKDQWENLSEHVYLLEENFEEKFQQAAKSKISDRFLGHPIGSRESLLDIADVINELWSSFPLSQAIETLSKHTDVYAYVMDYPTARSWTRQLAIRDPNARKNSERVKKLWGTCHGDDLQFLFKHENAEVLNDEYRPEENALKEIFLDTFTNFATTGDPNGGGSAQGERIFFKWPKYETERVGNKIFVYNPTPRLKRHLVAKESVHFWQTLFTEHGRREVKAAYASHKKMEL